jgi:hypothetical protein
VRADVRHLAGAGAACDVDQFVADGEHRDPGPRVHEHLVVAGRGQHADLSRAEHDVAAHGDVARLDVLSDPADERRGRHSACHRQLGCARVGVTDGHHRVGERGQRRACHHAHGLTGLQAQRVPRAGRDLTDDGQHDGRLLARPREVDAAHGVAVDRRLVEARQRAARDHLFGAAQTVCLGDRHADRCRPHRPGHDQCKLLVDRPHRNYASCRATHAATHRPVTPADPDAP